MATTALYLFNNGDISDSSGFGRNGSIAGAGPSFFSKGPGAIVGSKYIQNCTDSNYVVLPTSVYTGVTTTGTVKFSVFNAADTKVIISSNHGSYGNFFIYPTGGAFSLRVPTAAGYTPLSTSAHGMVGGQWYTIFIHWSPGAFKVDVKNTMSGVTINILNAAITANFGNCTDVRVGRDTIIGGYASNGPIDNVEYRDDDTNVDSQTYNRQTFIASFGHSYVWGTDGDGWRLGFQSYVDNTINKPNYLLVGQTNRGSTPTPYTDGINGAVIASVDAVVTANVSADFPAFDFVHNDFVVFVGPIEYNDAFYGTDINTYIATYTDVINKIYAISSNIKIMFVTNPLTPNGVNSTPYVNATKQVYAAELALGRNVYMADWASTPPFSWALDNIHPSTTGYVYMGNFIAQSIFNMLNPVAPTIDVVSVVTTKNTPIGGIADQNNGTFGTQGFGVGNLRGNPRYKSVDSFIDGILK